MTTECNFTAVGRPRCLRRNTTFPAPATLWSPRPRRDDAAARRRPRGPAERRRGRAAGARPAGAG
eukprot:6036472-Prymnesium_polylepis.1